MISRIIIHLTQELLHNSYIFLKVYRKLEEYALEKVKKDPDDEKICHLSVSL